MFNIITTHTDTFVAAAAAISAFSAALVVSWPYLMPDTLDARMTQLAQERVAIRLRERQKLQPSSLRAEPKQLFRHIVDRLNLVKHAQEAHTVQMLRMAGYRGEGPVITFLAMRLIAPIAMFVIALLYIFVVLHLPHPFMVKFAGAVFAALLGYYAPMLYLKNTIAKRQTMIRRAWPDALDLLLICVESGMGLESAFRKVEKDIGAQSLALADELSVLTAELAYLPERQKAYENLANRTGVDEIKSTVTSLIQAEKYGTPVSQTLRVLAKESRDARMSAAEKKAAALPPKLTVPMVLFFLPVLFAVIITPVAIQIANLR
jgi:tight adherence protein C